jgi:hypothetical protein
MPTANSLDDKSAKICLKLDCEPYFANIGPSSNFAPFLKQVDGQTSDVVSHTVGSLIPLVSVMALTSNRNPEYRRQGQISQRGPPTNESSEIVGTFCPALNVRICRVLIERGMLFAHRRHILRSPCGSGGARPSYVSRIYTVADPPLYPPL